MKLYPKWVTLNKKRFFSEPGKMISEIFPNRLKKDRSNGFILRRESIQKGNSGLLFDDHKGDGGLGPSKWKKGLFWKLAFFITGMHFWDFSRFTGIYVDG